jgi:hypothetical protein
MRKDLGREQNSSNETAHPICGQRTNSIRSWRKTEYEETRVSEIEHVTVFGSPAPGVEYFERRAAYAVIVNNGKIAMVKPGRTVGGKPNHFLPGGGSWPGEAPEDTVTREVTEELARSVLRFVSLARSSILLRRLR